MNILLQIFGEGKDLSILQMSARAVVVYFTAVLLIAISGKRTFSKKTAFDTTIAIVLGAILSRAIVGASPFMSTVGGSLALVLLHRGLGWLVVRSKSAEKFIKGSRVQLYKDGSIIKPNLRKCLLTEEDLAADIRLKANTEDFTNVDAVFMETSGEISVVLKDK